MFSRLTRAHRRLTHISHSNRLTATDRMNSKSAKQEKGKKESFKSIFHNKIFNLYFQHHFLFQHIFFYSFSSFHLPLSSFFVGAFDLVGSCFGGFSFRLNRTYALAYLICICSIFVSLRCLCASVLELTRSSADITYAHLNWNKSTYSTFCASVNFVLLFLLPFSISLGSFDAIARKDFPFTEGISLGIYWQENVARSFRLFIFIFVVAVVSMAATQHRTHNDVIYVVLIRRVSNVIGLQWRICHRIVCSIRWYALSFVRPRRRAQIHINLKMDEVISKANHAIRISHSSKINFTISCQSFKTHYFVLVVYVFFASAWNIAKHNKSTNWHGELELRSFCFVRASRNTKSSTESRWSGGMFEFWVSHLSFFNRIDSAVDDWTPLFCQSEDFTSIVVRSNRCRMQSTMAIVVIDFQFIRCLCVCTWIQQLDNRTQRRQLIRINFRKCFNRFAERWRTSQIVYHNLSMAIAVR